MHKIEEFYIAEMGRGLIDVQRHNHRGLQNLLLRAVRVHLIVHHDLVLTKAEIASECFDLRRLVNARKLFTLNGELVELEEEANMLKAHT